MMTVATLSKEEKKALEKINKANLDLALVQRCKGLCEVCFRSYGLALHHIGGRGGPRKDWSDELREDWPHNELNGIMICEGVHGAGDRSGRVHGALRHNRRLLWAWIMVILYPERIFRGRKYVEWFASGRGPWREF